MIISGKSKRILFADDAGLIFTDSNLEGSRHDIKYYLNKWFKANRLSLNFYKTCFI